MLTNQNMTTSIKVSTEDSEFKPLTKSKVVTVGKKKKTTKIKISSEEQLKELADKRVEAIKDYLESIKLSTRNIDFITEIKSKPSKPKTSTKTKTKSKYKAATIEPEIQTVKIYIKKMLKL